MAGELTYRQLLNWLTILKADESPMLDLGVTVKLDDEFRTIAHIMVTHEDDVLDKDHPYLITYADDDEDTEDCWDYVAGRPAHMRDEDWD